MKNSPPRTQRQFRVIPHETSDAITRGMNPFRRRLLIVLAVVATIVLVLPVAKYCWSRVVLRRLVGRLESQGERLTIDSIPRPQHAGARRTALEIANLLARIPTTANRNDLPFPMRPVSPGLALPAETTDPGGDPATRANNWEALSRLVGECQGTLNAIQQLLGGCEALDFGGSSDPRSGFNQPNLTAIRDLGRLLMFSAVHHLHQGNTAEAGRELVSLLTLIRCLRDETSAPWQQFRLMITSFALSLTWDFIQSGQVTEEQLSELQLAWASLEFLVPMERTIANERAWARALFAEARSDPGRRRQMFQSTSAAGRRSVPALTTSAATTLSGIAEQLSATLERSGELMQLWTMETLWVLLWSYDDERLALESSQNSLEALRSTRRGVPFDASLRGIEFRWGRRMSSDAPVSLSRFLSSQFVDPTRLLERAVVAVAQRELILTAISIRRFDLRENRWPTELGELLPTFLREVPRDPGDGRPLRYRLDTQGRPFLYSVGVDGLDQGGDATPPQGQSFGYSLWRGLDLVWPRVATVEEAERARKQAGGGSPRPRP